jgi:hypothetical protein
MEIITARQLALEVSGLASDVAAYRQASAALRDISATNA